MEYTQRFSLDSRYTMKIEITETVLEEQNASKLDYVVSTTKSSGNGYYDLSSKGTTYILKIDGSQVDYYRGPYDFRGSTPKTITFLTGSTIIQHNDDGDKTINLNLYGEMNSNDRGDATINQTIALTHIDVANKITDFGAKKIGEINTITTTSYQGATNALLASCNGATLSVTKQSETSFLVEVPYSVLTPTTSQETVVLTLRTTVNDRTIERQQSAIFTATGLKPDVLTASISPVGTTRWLQGLTKAKIDFSISSLASKYGATMTQYIITINGATFQSGTFSSGTIVGQAIVGEAVVGGGGQLSFSYTTDTFDDVGSYKIVIRAYDTRGQYDEYSYNINIVPNAQPRQVAFGGGKYRLFFASPIFNSNYAISDNSLRVLNCNIKEDALNKATSQFEVAGIPSALQVGDYVACYDSYKGQIIYSGICTDIDENARTITTQQVITFFDTNCIMEDYAIAYYELRIYTAISGFKASRMGNAYSDFVNNWTVVSGLTQTTNTDYKGPYTWKAKLGNIYSLIKEWYNSFGIISTADLSLDNGKLKPTISTFNPKTYYNKLTLADNTFALRNFTISKINNDYNSVIIWNKNTAIKPENIIPSRCFFVDDSYQIKRNDTTTNIPHKLKQKFVMVDPTEYNLSDQDVVDSLGRQNLIVEQYNHKIEFDLVFNNQLFDFFKEFKLGRELDLYIGDKYYSTVITGYYLDSDNEGEFATAHIICGKARLNLEAMLNGIRS